jgi:uncharacterized RDD family membrane protein YckC
MPENLALVPLQLASLRRRLAAALYDSLLLTAILFVASFLFLSFARDASTGWIRYAYQAYLLAIAASYIVYCETHGGQTLGMKTWHIAVTDPEGDEIDLRRALWRFPLAVAGWAGGLSILWSLCDRDRQFLHDRLASTRIITLPRRAR